MFDVMFTGHRPPKLGGWDEDNPVADKTRNWLRKQVAKRAGEGSVTFVSGGALGVDQWGAEAVLDRPGLQLIMAIPCDGYSSKWPSHSQKRFESILSKASLVKIVCPGHYESWKNISRDGWMVANSKQVIAVWDGVEQGGTWQTIKAARKAGRPITFFNPNTGEETSEAPVASKDVFAD